jgi:hypothetical protein
MIPRYLIGLFSIISNGRTLKISKNRPNRCKLYLSDLITVFIVSNNDDLNSQEQLIILTMGYFDNGLF